MRTRSGLAHRETPDGAVELYYEELGDPAGHALGGPVRVVGLGVLADGSDVVHGGKKAGAGKRHSLRCVAAAAKGGRKPIHAVVAVNGAAGYLGGWAVRERLGAGYRVRACVPDAADAVRLPDLMNSRTGRTICVGRQLTPRCSAAGQGSARALCVPTPSNTDRTA